MSVIGESINCQNPAGGIETITLTHCVDGTQLGSVSYVTDAPTGWFVAPGRYIVVDRDVSVDPGFVNAHRACVG